MKTFFFLIFNFAVVLCYCYRVRRNADKADAPIKSRIDVAPKTGVFYSIGSPSEAIHVYLAKDYGLVHRKTAVYTVKKCSKKITYVRKRKIRLVKISEQN